ncbi:MAG: hypothetical protein WCP57_01845 [Bacteroidota bacterium]
MQYPEHEPIKEEKPISELIYRLIALVLVLGAFFASVIATIFRLPPLDYIKVKLSLYGDNVWILWLISFVFFLFLAGIIMRLIKPFADVPKNPYGNLNISTFFKGDADQDEYKINDKN